MVLGPTAVILKMAHQRPELETPEAVIAQLGERQTEDLEVLGSIPSPGSGIFCRFCHGKNLRLLFRSHMRWPKSTLGKF